MKHYQYRTEWSCASVIEFDIEDNIITNIQFLGGCDGNLKMIRKILNGWTVEKIEEYCKGNTCGYKPSSCADQLAIAVRKAYEEK